MPDGHDYRQCFHDSQEDRDHAATDCPRFPCRVYKEGFCDGHDSGYTEGTAAGYAEGYNDATTTPPPKPGEVG